MSWVHQIFANFCIQTGGNDCSTGIKLAKIEDINGNEEKGAYNLTTRAMIFIVLDRLIDPDSYAKATLFCVEESKG